MFEHKTYDALLSEALSYAPAGVDTRQGSIYRDALTGPLLALAAFYADLDNVIALTRIDTAPGEYLDDKGEEYAVERQPAVCATYKAVIEGTQPEDGAEFTINDIEFDLFYDDNGDPYFECVEPGEVGNGLVSGMEAVPLATIEGLIAATVGDPIVAGVEEQEDDVYRERIQERISGPAENGNKQHYKTWCEEVDGVGYAKIIPLWEGPNTVKGIIYGEDGTPASQTVIDRVQNYVDPDADGDGRGDGLGEGVAEIGAHFTAFAPSTLPMTVSATVQLADGYTLEDVQSALEDDIAEYLKDLVIESNGATSPIVRYNAIGSIILDADGVLDYTDLLLNGATSNIQPDEDEVVMLDTLSLTEAE